MPEILTQYGENSKFQSRRHSFREASQDSYTKPPAQNAELFTTLTNVLPPSIEGVLKRRWGYQLWSSNSSKFRNLYEFQRDADLARRIVGTVSDATGSSSVTNKVAALNEDGTTYNSLIFTPSLNAARVYMSNSRDYGFFSDGVTADLLKWDGSSSGGSTKWGITAPVTAPAIGASTGGGAQTYALSSVANASAGNTVYTGTGLSGILIGSSVQIIGFSTGANNGTFTVVSATSTTVTVNNASGVSETASASLVTQNLVFPTTFLNGWGANAHVGSYEHGVDQGYFFGLDGGTTGAYTNPGNAFDGDPTTYAFASGQHTHAYKGCVWKFASQTSSATNITLVVQSEVPPNGTDGQVVNFRSAGIWYTTDGGVNWTEVYNSPNRPNTIDQISIPKGTDFGQVQVMAFLDSHDDMYQKVYEIYITSTTIGTGPINLDSGRSYFLAFENSSTAHFSDVSPISVSTGQVFGGAIPLSNLEVSLDPQVDKKVILATADGGNTNTLYLVAEIANATTSYTDGLNETALLAQNVYAFIDDDGNVFGLYENETPPNAFFPTKHRGRMFLADNQNLYFSKNLADCITPTGVVAGRFEEAFPPENSLDISAGAEVVRGLLSDGEFLYIGTDKRILRLVGDGPTNFQPPQTAFAQGGLNNPETWVPVFLDGQPLGTIWLTPDFRVIASDFNSHLDVGTPIQDILDTINPAASTNSHAVFYADGAYNFYVLAVPTGVNTDPDTLCVYDLKTRRWFVWTLTDSAIAFLYNITFAGIPQMLFWGSSGIGYKFLPTLTQDRVNNTPVSFTCTATTSWQDLGDPTIRKVLNWLQVMTQDTALLLTIKGASLTTDFASPRTVVSNASLVASPFKDLTLHLAGKTSRDRFYQFTFTSVASSLPIFLAGYDIRGFGWHSL